MPEEAVTLDFENSGRMTLDDISFGPPETIEEQKPVEVVEPQAPAPEKKTEVAPAAPVEKEEEQQELEEQKPTLDDLTFGELEEEEEDDNAPAGEKKEKVIDSDLKLAAIRAVINKKLERNNLEAEVDINDLTEEQLVDFEEEVDNTILEAKYSKVKAVDPRVETILNYLEDGGDPKKITSLFQQREVVDAIDISTKEGQASLIKSYYKNIKNLSEEEATKRLDKVTAADLLEEEAKDIKVEYDTYNDAKVAEELEKQKKEAVVRQQNETKKKIIFDKALKDNNVPMKLQDELKKVAFQEGILPSGEKIKIMDYKILQMQSEPESFYKLSMFLADPAGYEQMILQNAKNVSVTKEMKKGFNVETKIKSGVEKTQTVDSTKEKTKVKFNFN
jgi:hypothetical protein